MEMRAGFGEIGASLKHGGEIVLGCEIGGIARNVLAGEGFLQRQASLVRGNRVAMGKNLKPEMGHFIGGAVAALHTLGRIKGVSDVCDAVVVDVAHGDASLRRKDDFRVVVEHGLPIQIPTGNVNQSFAGAVGKCRDGEKVLAEIVSMRINGEE